MYKISDATVFTMKNCLEIVTNGCIKKYAQQLANIIRQVSTISSIPIFLFLVKLNSNTSNAPHGPKLIN